MSKAKSLAIYAVHGCSLAKAKAELLPGLLVALALIPEAIGFAVVAGVTPEMALYGSIVIAIAIAFLGGRRSMISGATASTSVLMGPVVHEHGIPYLLAATVLMGLLQIGAGLLRVDRLMQFISPSVMAGFVNALAILILAAQTPHLVGAFPVTYGLVLFGLVIIYGLPYITKSFPSPLAAVILLTATCAALHLHVQTIADLGQLPTQLPSIAVPSVPISMQTLRIIFPPALTLAAVALLETLLTVKMIDDITDTTSNRRRECIGQGIANILAPLLGGIGGCAMIGQSVINMTSGARGRLSTFAAGSFLLALLIIFRRVLELAPVASLTAVMIMVSINTFSWKSIATITSGSWRSSAVMVVTVLVVVATNNLAAGVVCGVSLSCLLFVGQTSRLVSITSALSSDGSRRIYTVTGQLFFASATKLSDAIDLSEGVQQIVVDFSGAQIRDVAAESAVDNMMMRAQKRSVDLKILGLKNQMRGNASR